MKKQKTYVAMLLAALVILSLAGCGMKNSKDNAEATTGWSVENPDNTTKDKKTTESTDAEDDIEEDADGIMDNLGAGTFDTYEDAKNYLMDKLTADNEDMSYEFREETQELTSYDGMLEQNNLLPDIPRNHQMDALQYPSVPHEYIPYLSHKLPAHVQSLCNYRIHPHLLLSVHAFSRNPDVLHIQTLDSFYHQISLSSSSIGCHAT